MKPLTIRRWLGLAWLIYILSTMSTVGLVSVVLWENWHKGGTTQLNWFNGESNFPFWLYPLSIITIQLIISGLISWFVGRTMLEPLAAMSQAARQIARNDLNFSLPPSQVREVAEVAQAFEEMGRALRESLGRQAHLEQERRLFISAVAHDLGTPLFALRGYLEGLERGLAATPERAAHYLAICREKADDLEKRIADLFAYARLEYLGQTPRHEKVELENLLAHVVESFKPQLEAKQIELKLKGLQNIGAVDGDKQLLSRVFENLLDNAIRHTPRQGTVWLSGQREGCQFRFSLADNGPGIAETSLKYLFEPLYRGEPTTAQDTNRAGLGLTIARNILHSHGGGLRAANRAEGGALFEGWLTLEPG